LRILKSGGSPLGKELEDTVRAKFPQARLGQVCPPHLPFIIALTLLSKFILTFGSNIMSIVFFHLNENCNCFDFFIYI